MDTEKIKVLLSALEKGSLMATASDLGYTTSGISRMMDSLEQEVGFQLLIRNRSGIAATEECTRMIPVFQEITYWANRSEQLSKEINRVESGSVTIGVCYSAYVDSIAKTVALFKEQHPKVEICILNGESSELCRAMEYHKIDLCIVSDREGDFNRTVLLKDPLMAWVPINHQLANDESFSIQNFETEPYIETFIGENTDCDRFFAQHNIVPNTQYKCSDVGSCYALVELGLGIGLNNNIISRKWKHNMKILPLDPPHVIDIVLMYPKGEFLSPAAKKFIQFAKQQLVENDKI